jgi:DNA modification methylase
VLIDRNHKIIAGHGRVLACKTLGITEVPTICLDHLSESQAKAFLIADNRLTEIALWDDRLLAEQLKALSEVELDFSLDAIGFEMGEIDMRIEGLTQAGGEEDAADRLPEVTNQPVISKTGDLWLLGQHRVYCGDARDPNAYAALLGERRAHMVFTDPPYNVPIRGHASGLGKIQHQDFAMAAGEMSEVEFTAFLTDVCRLLANFSSDGTLHFICMDWRHMTELLKAGRDVYTELKNLCVWVKDNAGMGSLYRSRHELVFVFKQGRGTHRNNVQLGQFGRYRSNVWEYAGVNSFGRSTEEGNLLELHPTVKPVAMVADALMDCSGRGDIVLDAFLGSGTTLIAAQRTGRICYALEIGPHYVDTAIRRWQAFTGEKARHAMTNQAFDDVRVETAVMEGHHGR